MGARSNQEKIKCFQVFHTFSVTAALKSIPIVVLLKKDKGLLKETIKQYLSDIIYDLCRRLQFLKMLFFLSLSRKMSFSCNGYALNILVCLQFDLYQVYFIDLDLKRLSKVEDYYELDKKIVNCYRQIIKMDQGRNEETGLKASNAAY